MRMSEVINFQHYQSLSRREMLVLVDLQQETVSTAPEQPRALTDTLTNCRAALQHARRIGAPVAFTRSVMLEGSSNGRGKRWLDGFSPTRSDRVFDRYKPSCYASTDFSDIISASGGHFTLAGLAGETACLSTAVDALHRGHKITFLSDASASHGLGDLNPAETHHLIVKLVGLYGSVSTTAQWIANCSRTASLSARQ